MLCVLMLMTLLLALQLPALAQSENSESPEPILVETNLPPPISTNSADSALEKAYTDTFNLLSERN